MSILEGVINVLLELLAVSYRRLYACLLLSIATCGLVLWLVPSSGWKVAISITTVVFGIVSGVLWERRSSW